MDGDLAVTGGSLLFGSGLAASEGQEGVVGGNHVQSGGTVNIRGASYTVSGNYVEGLAESASRTAQFVSIGGRHTVKGPFSVGSGSGNLYRHLSNGGLHVEGDLSLLGAPSFVGMTLGPDASLGMVVINSSGGGITLNSDARNGGDLVLERGIIESNGYTWLLENEDIEEDLKTRTRLDEGDVSTVLLGGRLSFVGGGYVARKVSQGNLGGGDIGGGYLFPVGEMASSEGLRRNRYRSLILQLGADASEADTVSVSTYTADETMLMDMSWPDAGLSVPTGGGDLLILDTYAPMMWKVEFSANGRINGIVNITQDAVLVSECNVFGIAANHVENPIGLAPPDPPPAVPMANLQLIHNVVGAVVDVYVDDVRIADDLGYQTATSLSTEIAAGSYQVHIVGSAATDNSTPLVTIPVEFAEDGSYTLIVSGSSTNVAYRVLSGVRSESVVESNVEFRLVHGAADLGVVDVRPLERAENTPTGELWVNNLEFNGVAGYKSVSADVYAVEVTTSNQDRQIDMFELDLGDYTNQGLLLALSGVGGSSGEGLTLMGVTSSGEVFFPSVITSLSSVELPESFALSGNYPNPFNPSTRIVFDLPSSAEVSVEVLDLLGRSVLSLGGQSIEAGSNRALELDGSLLASGTYLYRVIAKLEGGVEVQTGRMVLIK